MWKQDILEIPSLHSIFYTALPSAVVLSHVSKGLTILTSHLKLEYEMGGKSHFWLSPLSLRSSLLWVVVWHRLVCVVVNKPTYTAQQPGRVKISKTSLMTPHKLVACAK
jgi:hypothetical protein